MTVGAIIFLIMLAIFGFRWYYSSTASGMRAIKDQQSNLNNGLNREITTTAEDGLRRTIYWGITDTIIIEELN